MLSEAYPVKRRRALRERNPPRDGRRDAKARAVARALRPSYFLTLSCCPCLQNSPCGGPLTPYLRELTCSWMCVSYHHMSVMEACSTYTCHAA